MAGEVYRIKDWSDLFENNRTRELKHLNWIPLPAKLDGDGYTELVDDKNGAGLYGCWCACVIIAGRCDPRGTLVRATNVPHDYTSLARISRLDKLLMQRMLDKALSIGWLEVTDTALPCEIPAPPCPLPNPNPNPNPNPIDTSLLAKYNALSFVKKVRKLTKERKDKLRSRLRDPDWQPAFAEALSKLPIPGDGWQPDFDWLIANDTNVERILEGKYDWRAEQGNCQITKPKPTRISG